VGNLTLARSHPVVLPYISFQLTNHTTNHPPPNINPSLAMVTFDSYSKEMQGYTQNDDILDQEGEGYCA
jgi:hypothetical protein